MDLMSALDLTYAGILFRHVEPDYKRFDRSLIGQCAKVLGLRVFQHQWFGGDRLVLLQDRYRVLTHYFTQSIFSGFYYANISERTLIGVMLRHHADTATLDVYDAAGDHHHIVTYTDRNWRQSYAFYQITKLMPDTEQAKSPNSISTTNQSAIQQIHQRLETVLRRYQWDLNPLVICNPTALLDQIRRDFD